MRLRVIWAWEINKPARAGAVEPRGRTAANASAHGDTAEARAVSAGALTRPRDTRSSAQSAACCASSSEGNTSCGADRDQPLQ